ncbi:hypothetical protein DAH66_06055 [Sphingomonas koreensis]|uniref:Disulfide bond formation protein B n=2 Tax=Sphingomonas koreensis TaxID=93064 RepID=A0A430G6P7_9SPHN|nr:hypothetical protein DAH66_06055 [Sphingomonas koreensis]
MFNDLPDILLRHRLWVGLAAIALAAATWAIDLTGLVYACPYCRVQRTVIGLLGLLLLLPDPAHWLVRYLSAVFAVFGLSVGATQHFRGWAKIFKGEFSWGEQWYVNAWALSGFALFIITGLLLLIWRWKRAGAVTEVAQPDA